MANILIVDDEAAIADLIQLTLAQAGCKSETAMSGSEAADKLEKERYDLVLLDVMLPEISGFELMEYLAPTGTPVIFLTAMTDESSIITGFHLGADDYITKPFRLMELICRIQNALRKSGKVPSVFQVEDLHVDATKGVVIKSGKEIVLSALEYRLLLVFLNHFGETLSRNDLLHEIWDIAGDYVNDNC